MQRRFPPPSASLTTQVRTWREGGWWIDRSIRWGWLGYPGAQVAMRLPYSRGSLPPFDLCSIRRKGHREVPRGRPTRRGAPTEAPLTPKASDTSNLRGSGRAGQDMSVGRWMRVRWGWCLLPGIPYSRVPPPSRLGAFRRRRYRKVPRRAPRRGGTE